jgi:hypothetical protein
LKTRLLALFFFGFAGGTLVLTNWAPDIARIWANTVLYGGKT